MVFLEAAGFIAGLLLIVKGSEWVTDAVSVVASRLRTTNVAVGLLVVSLLLSLPELAVAISSILKGHAQIAFGVALGSVIVNLALIIGVSAYIRPLVVPPHVVTRDGIFMLVATLIVATFALGNLQVRSSDGLVLLLLIIPYAFNVYLQEKQLAKSEQSKEAESISKTLALTGRLGVGEIRIKDGPLILGFGALMLLAGSELFTNALISLSDILGVSGLLIGLTIGAIGPSLPNLAAAVQAAKRGYGELVVSETIGSNIFTLLITIGIIAMLSPITIDFPTAIITTPALIAVTIVFFHYLNKGIFTKKSGGVLIALYAVVLLLEFAARH